MMYWLWHKVIMYSFQCWYHQSVFQKTQLLYLKWLLASFLWCLTEDLILLGLFDCKVSLTTTCSTVKVSENVVEEAPLSQTREDMNKPENKTLFECVNKNSGRLICLTNQLEILNRAACKVFSWCLSSTPSHCFSLRPKFSCWKML